MRDQKLSEVETKVLAYIDLCASEKRAATPWGCSRLGLKKAPLIRGGRDREVDNALRRLKGLGLIEHRKAEGIRRAGWWVVKTDGVLAAVQGSALEEVK